MNEYNFKNRQEAITAYMDKYGGFPFMLLRGVSDEDVIDAVKFSMQNNEEIIVNLEDHYIYVGDKSLNELRNNNNTGDEGSSNTDKVIDLNIVKNNMESLLSYSILNKSIDELLLAKKRFIEDWLYFLESVSGDDWMYDCNIYRAKISSIIDSILQRVRDMDSIKQLDLLNKIVDYLKSKDLKNIIDLVNSINQLELK